MDGGNVPTLIQSTLTQSTQLLSLLPCTNVLQPNPILTYPTPTLTCLNPTPTLLPTYPYPSLPLPLPYPHGRSFASFTGDYSTSPSLTHPDSTPTLS